MYSKEVVLVGLLALVQISVQLDYNEARQVIYDAMDNYEKQLLKAMAEMDPSVVVQPVRELKETEQVAYQDLDAIQNFEGPGDKEQAIASSVEFWKRKMEEIIEPYVSNPESYRGVVVVDDKPLEDPTSDQSEAYRTAAMQINQRVESAVQNLMAEYEKLPGQTASRLEEVTVTTWRKAAYGWALEAAVGAIRRQGQLAKYDAASGNVEKGITWLDRVIMTTTATFRTNAQDIYERTN